MSNPPGWRPDQRSPPPQNFNDTEGWRRYVAVTLEHILVRLHYIERDRNHPQQQSPPASDAPITKPPATWADRRELAKDVASIAKDVRTGLMWIAAIILLLGLIAKKLDLTQLPTLKSWLGTLG